MRKLLIITLIMLMSMSLSLYAKTKAVKQLEQNLQQWEQFRWQGILQVQSSAFSIRKNFVLSKNSEALRLDVLDSGVMGLQAKPLVTLYIKDSIQFEAPTIKELIGIDLNWFVPKSMVQTMLNFTDSLKTKEQEIISTKKVTTDKTVFTFDKKLRLTTVANKASGFEAHIIYNRHNQPTKMHIKHRGSQVAELLINERIFKNIEIEPLKTSSQGIDLEEFLQDIPLEEIELLKQ
jgi:hypothetical protein